MNYLAHLYLAEDSPESLIGNLLGDFLKGRGVEGYCESIKKGIQLHKHVDIYTDAHQIFRQSKRLIDSVNQRYSGIIVDVFYDHFLAKNWLHYSAVPLHQFTSNVYKTLQDNESILPESLRKHLPNIINNNILMSYAEIQGVKFTLQRLSARLKRANQLENASDDLIAKYECFELNFSQFFPELIDYVQTLR